MSRFHSGLYVVAFLGVAANGPGVEQPADPQLQRRQTVLSAAEDSPSLARAREKLGEPVTLEFVETPIGDVIDFLKDYTTLNIVLDKPALEEQGVNRDTPVSIHLQNVKLSSALNQLLRQFNLAYVLKDACLVITSATAADDSIVARSYPVGDLVATPEDAAKLVLLIERVLTAGGGGPIVSGATSGVYSAEGRLVLLDSLKAVVLTENRAAHSRVTRLLEQLRGDIAEPDSVKKIRSKLIEPVTLEFVETPLSDVFDFLRDYTGVNIVLDRQSLEEEGVSVDTPVSVHVQAIELREALKVLLNTYKLTFTTEDECLVITSKVSERKRFVLRTYPVGKLLGGPHKLGDEWLNLTRWALVDCVVDANANPGRRGFAPGSKVVAQWAEAEFPATVVDLTEDSYFVQFRVGNKDRDEWLHASRVQSPSRKTRQPVPLIEFYETGQALVVLGPESLQNQVEMLIGLVVKTAEQAAK